MTTFAEAVAAAHEDGVHTLYLTREEGLEVLRVLCDAATSHTPVVTDATARLASLLNADITNVV